MHKILKGTFILTVPLFLCGINKVFFSKQAKIVHAILSLLWTLTIVSYPAVEAIEEHDLSTFLWSLGHSTEYLQLVFISFVTGQDFIKVLEAKLKIIEDYTEIVKDTTVVVKTNVVVVLLFLYKLFHMIVVMESENSKYQAHPALFTIFQITVFCTELECIWKIFLMMTIKSKIDQVHEGLKELYPKEWFENVEICCNVQNRVSNLKEAYYILVELTEDIAKATQISIIHRLASDVLVALLTVYYFTQNGGSLLFSSFTVLLVFLAILTLCPFVILEMIKSKSFDIKVILIQQGLRANIKSKEKIALKNFANVIMDQPIRLRIFGSYDMGADFIVHYFHFLATYSIFILQTAKYKFF